MSNANTNTMTIVSNDHGREVELIYTPEIAELVRAIEDAGSVMQDGVLQAEDMLRLFPMRAELHTTTMEYRALLEAGCVEVSR